MPINQLFAPLPGALIAIPLHRQKRYISLTCHVGQINDIKVNRFMSNMKIKTGKVEEKVVNAYKTIENGVVKGYQKIEDKFVEKFLEVEEEIIEIPENGDEDNDGNIQ